MKIRTIYIGQIENKFTFTKSLVTTDFEGLAGETFGITDDKKLK